MDIPTLQIAVLLRSCLIGIAGVFFFASCDTATKPNDAADRHTEYKVIEMNIDDTGKFSSRKMIDFEKQCSELVADGWIPAGGITIEEAEEARSLRTCTQAFYR